MYMKSLVSLAVLGAMSAVATAGDHVVFDNPNESYTVDRLSKYGATIKASDITITNTTYNGIDAYGVFDLNAANDISIQGATNGIFTPTDHENSSITIKAPSHLTARARPSSTATSSPRQPRFRLTSMAQVPRSRAPSSQRPQARRRSASPTARSGRPKATARSPNSPSRAVSSTSTTTTSRP